MIRKLRALEKRLAFVRCDHTIAPVSQRHTKRGRRLVADPRSVRLMDPSHIALQLPVVVSRSGWHAFRAARVRPAFSNIGFTELSVPNSLLLRFGA